MRSYMCDYSVLKEFNIVCHAPNSLVVTKVIWQPSLLFWVKCNTYGAFRDSLRSFACDDFL